MGQAIAAQLEAMVDEHLAELRERLRRRGFAARAGFGRRPAVLVVDFVRAFTDEDSPLGADFSAEVAATARLVSAAHGVGAPVLFTIPLEESGGWSRKVPANDMLVRGSEWVALDERLGVAGEDLLVPKRYASGFFATDLTTLLVSRGVDTVVIAGCTTSGCVRACAVDACSLGLHTIVVGEAVGDRAPLSHRISLFDIDTKYGDVVSLDDAVTYLERVA
jgi:nicotinamidase-related amidase